MSFKELNFKELATGGFRDWYPFKKSLYCQISCCKLVEYTTRAPIHAQPYINSTIDHDHPLCRLGGQHPRVLGMPQVPSLSKTSTLSCWRT